MSKCLMVPLPNFRFQAMEVSLLRTTVPFQCCQGASVSFGQVLYQKPVMSSQSCCAAMSIAKSSVGSTLGHVFCDEAPTRRLSKLWTSPSILIRMVRLSYKRLMRRAIVLSKEACWPLGLKIQFMMASERIDPHSHILHSQA